MSTPPEQMPPQSGQAPTVRQPKRWPLVQTYSSRNGTLLQDARLVNAYAERDPHTGDWVVEKRPGLAGYAYSSPGTIGLGIMGAALTSPAITTLAIETPGNCFSIIPGLASQLIGSVDGSYPYSFLRYDAGAMNTVVFQNETGAYYLANPLPGHTPMLSMTGTTITGFPSGPYAFGWAFLDGTLYIMDSQNNIWGSNINDMTTWNALNVIQAGSTPDKAIALTSHLTYVIAFKQNSTNIFYDAGNATGSPLASVQGALIPYGCEEGTTVQEIDGNCLWLAAGPENVPQVAQLSNLSFSIVSTPPVDRFLLQYSGNHIPALPNSNYWRSSVLKMGGHRFYLLTSLAANVTLAYDIDYKLWHVWQDAQGNMFPLVSAASPSFSGPTVVLGQQIHALNGLYYQVLPDYLQSVDAISGSGGFNFTNAAPTVDIYTPSYDGGTRRRKQLNFMFFNASKYPGSTLKSRFNEDDYDSTQWSNFRTIDLSLKTPILPSNGSFRRRAYHFQHRCPTPFRLSSIDLQMDLGTL